MSKITVDKQEQLLEQILKYINECIEQGVPPTVREIAKELSIKSTSTVHKYLQILEDKGSIKRREGLNRSITNPKAVNVISHGSKVFQIPILGTVTAGLPILAVEDIEGYIPYFSETHNATSLFALRVKGESMVDIGILGGDVVIVAKTPIAENRDIVVALVEDEATVKRFFKEDGRFRLQPENSTMKPIFVDDLMILGKVVGLVRSFN